MPSGRVYAYDYNPPKVAGVDDETGEELVQREVCCIAAHILLRTHSQKGVCLRNADLQLDGLPCFPGCLDH
eukprot:SAG31_NODE_5_length_43735_cov_42.922266_38_plen_71_part_00